jgi:hypothetical protein
VFELHGPPSFCESSGIFACRSDIETSHIACCRNDHAGFLVNVFMKIVKECAHDQDDVKRGGVARGRLLGGINAL